MKVYIVGEDAVTYAYSGYKRTLIPEFGGQSFRK